jgi:hypothetical protein
LRSIYGKLRNAVDAARRQELESKTQVLGLRYLDILPRVGVDRLEAERRYLVHLLVPNYREQLITQIDEGVTMNERTWDTVSALLAMAAAIEVLLLEKHPEVFERTYGPEFEMGAPPIGTDLLAEGTRA